MLSIGLLRISAQYTTIDIDDAIYQNSLERIMEGAPTYYTFDNISTFYYGSMALRPIQSRNKFIRNSEIVTRYETGITPENAIWHINERRTLIGYNYWLHVRSALKLVISVGDENVLYAQFALGF